MNHRLGSELKPEKKSFTEKKGIMISSRRVAYHYSLGDRAGVV